MIDKNKIFKILVIFLFLIIITISFSIFIFLYKNKENKNLNLLKKIKKEILNNFADWEKEQLANIKIEKEIDLYDDNEKELLVDLGSGGAAVNIYLLFKLSENNNPKLIKFFTSEEKISSLYLRQGSGGASRYGFDFVIISQEGIVYLGNYYAYNSIFDNCNVSAYKYNKEKALLEFNKQLSEKYQKDYCSKICQSVPNELKEYFSKICQQIK